MEAVEGISFRENIVTVSQSLLCLLQKQSFEITEVLALDRSRGFIYKWVQLEFPPLLFCAFGSKKVTECLLYKQSDS